MFLGCACATIASVAKQSFLVFSLLAFSPLAIFSCGSDVNDGCVPGSLGCECALPEACARGLMCEAGMCVTEPEVATGGSTTGGAPATGGMTTGGEAATGGDAATGGEAATGGAATGGQTATGGLSSAETGGAEAGGGTDAGGSPGTGGSDGTGGAAGAACDASLAAENKALVDAAINQLFVMGDTAAIDTYWADPYLQHNPLADSGVAAFRSLFEPLITPGEAIYEPARTIGECDKVLIHGSYTTFGGPTFDMFRIEDGHLVEHWDSEAVDNGPNASGRTALDGPAEPGAGDEADNGSLVRQFIEAVLIGGAVESAADYLAADLMEHNPAGEDGLTAYVSYLESNSITYSTIHHQINDGDFVFTMSEGSAGTGAYGFYDLFRVEAGEIVEHWYATREVPETTQSGLGIF